MDRRPALLPPTRCPSGGQQSSIFVHTSLPTVPKEPKEPKEMVAFLIRTVFARPQAVQFKASSAFSLNENRIV
jgi:hypothetical protein